MGTLTATSPIWVTYIVILSWWLTTGLISFLLTRKKRLTFMIMLGTLLWWLPMAKSGLYYSYGIGFWGPHGHDAIWHLAIIEHFSNSLSLDNPIFAGTKLQNYHFGYDLIQAIIHRLTGVPNPILYFQILPMLIASLIGVFTYKLSRSLYPSKTYIAYTTVAFVFLSGSAGWMVTLFRGQGIGGESMFWAMQPISTMVNPPFALSILLLLLALNCYHHYLKSPTTFYLIVTILLFGILAQVKVYASMLLLTSLGIVLLPHLFHAIKNRTFTPPAKRLLVILTCVSLISLLTLLPVTKFSNQPLFNFQPFWFISTMLGAPDRFDWPRLEYARQSYRIQNYLLYIIASMAGIAIFYLGNLWTRIISIPYITRRIQKLFTTSKQTARHQIEIIVSLIILLGLVIPFFFTQSSTAWNTIQLMYYALFFSAFFIAPALDKYLTSRKKIIVGSILILLINLPTTYGTLTQYLSSEPTAYISSQEVQMLRDLRHIQSQGVVLVPPYAYTDRSRPLPLREHTTSAYVSAYSHHRTYLEDEVNLDITGVDWQARKQQLTNIWNTPHQDVFQNFMTQNNIQYIYEVKSSPLVINPENAGFTLINENNEIALYKRRN